MYILTLLIVLSGICNGYRSWNMLGRQPAALSHYSCSMLPVKRLFPRGTHESTEEEEKVQVVVPVSRQRMPVSDPYMRRGADGKRVLVARPDGKSGAIEPTRNPSKTKAKSDPMEYAKTKLSSESSISVHDEYGDADGSASYLESSPSRRSASSRSPSKNSALKISACRAATVGGIRSTSEHNIKFPSKNADITDPLLAKSGSIQRILSSENTIIRSKIRTKTLSPTARNTSKQTEQQKMKTSTDMLSRQVSQEHLVSTVSREASMVAGPPVSMLSLDSMDETVSPRTKRRALLDSPSASHATATEASGSFDELRMTRVDIPRSKSEVNLLAVKDVRAKSENLRVTRGFSDDGIERLYRSTSDTTTDTTARPHTIQTANPVLQG